MKRYLFSALVLATTIGVTAPSAQAAKAVLRLQEQTVESVAIAKVKTPSYAAGIDSKETKEIAQTKGFRRGGRGFRRRGRGFRRRGFGRRGFRRGHH